MTHTRPSLDGGIRPASWARGSRRSAMQWRLSVASRPGAISFALGLPAGGACPAFIYAIADGHNPLGVSLSAPKRARLVELARRYGVPVVGDDPSERIGEGVERLARLLSRFS